MKHQTLFCLTLLGLLGGCADHQVRDRLNAEKPEVLRGGRQSIEMGAPTQEWLDRYAHVDVEKTLPDVVAAANGAGSSYNAAKARAWADAASYEYGRHNQWGFVQEAMAESSRQVSLAGEQAQTDNADLRTVAMIRPDLWERLKAYRNAGGPGCTSEQTMAVARAEVELMHAGHEAWRRNFRKAEDRANGVEASLDGAGRCTVGMPVAQAHEAPRETRKLSADALFRFDSGNLAGILPAGRVELERLAADLSALTDIERIDVVGYTDRIGSDAANVKLSNERAQSVVAYLRGHGVSHPLQARGEGKGNPVVQCEGPVGNALIRCLQPNRRVEVRILGK